ncbi:hypothetical protein [Nocardia rhizosphaerae]|uniref:DUF397 domain-containing protein n=1 Tax=Nocardia rhizosphaerae TaxID=1691571 RepID=A0ABV8LF49_9NOCA
MRRDHLIVAPHDPDGVWLAYPTAGKRSGEGGDCYEVKSFGDDELAAYRYCNRVDGFKAVLVKPGQTVLDAVNAMADAHD